jgi:hypothetical protein
MRKQSSLPMDKVHGAGGGSFLKRATSNPPDCYAARTSFREEILSAYDRAIGASQKAPFL